MHRCTPIAQSGSADNPRERIAPGGPPVMNETVYLFALSLPALLAPIVADPDEYRAPALPVIEEQAVAEAAWI